MFRTFIALAALSITSDALAQTSTCTSIGGGMTHCDNMGTNGSMSSTNCTDLGGGITTCNRTGNSQPTTTPDMSHPQTNGSTLDFIGGLLAHSRERSLEKKLSQMIASGDCDGAASFAYLNRRNDLGDQIHRSCQPTGRTSELSTAEQSGDVKGGLAKGTPDASALIDWVRSALDSEKSQTTSWKKISEATSGSVFYYDRNSLVVSSNGELGLAMMMIDSKADVSVPYGKLIDTYWIDCRSSEMARMERVVYFKDGKSYNDRNWDKGFSPPHGPMMELFLNQICEK